MVRIPAFHVGGPGSIPGVGTNVTFCLVMGTDVGFGVVVDVKPPGRGARSGSNGVVPAPGKGWMLSAAAILGASLLEGDSRKGTSIGVEPDRR